jgi:hypothetical protein
VNLNIVGILEAAGGGLAAELASSDGCGGAQPLELAAFTTDWWMAA